MNNQKEKYNKCQKILNNQVIKLEYKFYFYKI